MKRSKAVSLLYLGIAATVLQGCDEEPRPRDYAGTPPAVTSEVSGEGAYFSLPECLTRFDQHTCTAAFAAAQGEHTENAPRFASRESCESFSGPGMCEPAPAPEAAAAASEGTAASSAPVQQASSGGSVFMPMLMGFMVGQAIGNLSGAGRGYYAGPPAGCDRYRLNAAPGTQCAPPPRSAGGGVGGGSAYVGSTYSTNRAGRDAPFSPAAAQGARIAPASIADTRVAGSSPASVGRGLTSVPRGAVGGSSTAAPRAAPSQTSRGGFGSTGSSRAGVSGS